MGHWEVVAIGAAFGLTRATAKLLLGVPPISLRDHLEDFAFALGQQLVGIVQGFRPEPFDVFGPKRQLRLRTIGYGRERPQCGEAVESCWRKNRRAHIVLR